VAVAWPGYPPPRYHPGDRVHCRKVGVTKAVASSRWDGAEYNYTLVDADGVHDTGYLEAELRCVKRAPREKSMRKPPNPNVQLGRSDYRNSKNRYENGFPADSDDHRAWDRGWMAEHRANNR